MFTVAYLLSYVSAVSILLPFVGVFILAVRTRKEKLNADIFYISIYLLIITLAQSLIFIYAVNGICNYFLFNVFYPFEFALFFYLIAQWLDGIKKYSVLIALAILISFYFVIGLFGSFNKFPVMAVFVESAVLIPLAFNSVIRMVRVTIDSYRLTLFRGILFYALGNLLMVGFISASVNEANIIQSILNIYANYLFLISLINYGRK